VAFEILQVAGFKVLNETEKVKIDWKALHDYCKKNEERIRALFDVERRVWKETLTPDEKKSLNKYVNHKLDKMLAIQLKSETTKKTHYIIKYQFKWLGKQSFESEKVKTEFPITEADLISEDEIEFSHTRLLSKNEVSTRRIENKEIASSYKMPLVDTFSGEKQEQNQEAEKAKIARLEYERKEREAEYVKNWLLEQKKKSKERYLKTKERKMALKQSNVSV
jgi:hypothetical protein